MSKANKLPEKTNLQCPRCLGHEMKRNSDFGMTHWRWNPVSAFLEVVLGLRILPLSYICQSCKGSILLRAYIHCEKCGALFDSQLWKGLLSLFRWDGHRCPCCHEEMGYDFTPWSKALLTITSPFWYLPWRLLRKKVMAWNDERMAQKLLAANEVDLDGKQCYVVASADPKLAYDTAGMAFGVFFSLFIWLYFRYVENFQLLIEHPLKSALALLFFGLMIGRHWSVKFKAAMEKNAQL